MSLWAWGVVDGVLAENKEHTRITDANNKLRKHNIILNLAGRK